MMDWKVAWTTFAAILIAEMGDKTQLAAITLTASSKKPWAVFLGAAVALALVTGIGVLGGELITKYIPGPILTKIAAILFVVIGLWTWFKG
jgi:Ca2+/H+ antiporter, TMEM165/GDT1 family